MGLLSLFKNLNLGFSMPHIPTTASVGTMEAKELKEAEQDNKMPLAGDHHEITGVEKDARIGSDETGSCMLGVDCKFNHPSREGDHDLENIASSENAGQECKFYFLPGGCKYGNDCRFLHPVQLNFLGLPIRLGEKECPFYMRTGGCKYASRCRFHHPDPAAVVGDSLQDRKNGVPSQHHGPAEQLCETRRPSENTSNVHTAFLGPFIPNWGLQQKVHWIGNQTVASLLHPPEIKAIDQQQELANKEAAYEFSGGEPQHFDEYPQRPSEPECRYFMKTGYCKFKSACRYHHSKSNLSSPSLPLTSASNNYETVASLLHPPEIKAIDQQQELANKDVAYEFSGGEPQHFAEYPQRPSEPECQYFMKTGYCKFKSACLFHHPKSNISSLSLPLTPASNNYEAVASLLHPPETKAIDQHQELANKDVAYEFSGGEPQHFDEYPQRPSEPKCPYFMKTGYCKFKSACRYHHPKSNLSSLSLPLMPASNNHETVASLLHPPEIKAINQQQEIANKDAVYEFSGIEPQHFDEYPQRPSEPKCQYFMKTGYCMFKSACRYHHPKSNFSSLSLPLIPASNNYEQDGPVEQLREISLPSGNTSNDQTDFLCQSSSNVPGLFTFNSELHQCVQWSGDQMATSPLHPPEIKINENSQELANKDSTYEFNGSMKSRQFDEYPQRPSEPECQYFMKTGYCKYKSACRWHHPKSNLSFPATPLKPMAKSPFHHPTEIKKNERGQELANNDVAYEINGGVKPQLFDEYPQRPGEPECHYFIKTGFCKFKSACRCHHPKSSLSLTSPPLKPEYKPICTHYSRHGICKFGSACKYSHHLEHT